MKVGKTKIPKLGQSAHMLTLAKGGRICYMEGWGGMRRKPWSDPGFWLGRVGMVLTNEDGRAVLDILKWRHIGMSKYCV